MPNRIENYTGHTVTILANTEFGTERLDMDPSLPSPARAVEARRPMGFVAIASVAVPIIEVSHTSTINIPQRRVDVFGVASLDTLRAQHHEIGANPGLFAPDDIVRDESGTIIGARHLATPRIQMPFGSGGTMLADEDLPGLAPPEEWQNAAAFDMRIFHPDTADVIDDLDAAEVLLEVPRSRAPVDLRRLRVPNPQMTEQLGVPVVSTWHSEVVNPQTFERGVVTLMPQEAVRAEARLRINLAHTAILGGLVRNRSGVILGGREINVYSPEMLAKDPF